MFLCQMQHGGGMGWPTATRGFILSRYKLGAKTTGLQSQLSSDAAICWSQPSSHLELPRFMPPPPIYLLAFAPPSVMDGSVDNCKAVFHAETRLRTE